MYEIGQLLYDTHWHMLIVYLGKSSNDTYPHRIYNFTKQIFDEASDHYIEAFVKIDNVDNW
jgi:hypothetical protein